MLFSVALAEMKWDQFVAVMQVITQTAENTVKPFFEQILLLVLLRSKQWKIIVPLLVHD